MLLKIPIPRTSSQSSKTAGQTRMIDVYIYKWDCRCTYFTKTRIFLQALSVEWRVWGGRAMIVTKCSGWGDCYGIPVCCRTAVVLTCTRYNNIIISITFLYRIQRWSLSATQTNYTPPFLTHLVSHKSLRKQHNIII